MRSLFFFLATFSVISCEWCKECSLSKNILCCSELARRQVSQVDNVHEEIPTDKIGKNCEGISSQGCASWLSRRVSSFTQTGQSHGSKVDGLHGIWSFCEGADKLEVEDAANQTTDAARREQNHLRTRDRQMRWVRKSKQWKGGSANVHLHYALKSTIQVKQ